MRLFHAVMGSCLSKKRTSSSSTSPTVGVKSDLSKLIISTQAEKNTVVQVEGTTTKNNKEIFVIKHRRSHSRNLDGQSKEEVGEQKPVEAEIEVNKTPNDSNCSNNVISGAEIVRNDKTVGAKRTSSCTREEVDAILIQCGRLSRSSSGNAADCGTPSRARKYSGSKRSYDFDHDRDGKTDMDVNGFDADLDNKNNDSINSCSRQSRTDSQGRRRRRTPSREREHRSISRERNSNGGSNEGRRRVSRSPNRRTENPQLSSSTSASNGSTTNRPGKMVAVPAAVAIDKSNNESVAVKRVLVKRNTGGEVAVGSKTAVASPRSRSPAKFQQQPSLSRSSSRKAEQSPYRRNPLADIDTNKPVVRNKEMESEGFVKEPSNALPQNKPNVEVDNSTKSVAVQCSNKKSNSNNRGQLENKLVNSTSCREEHEAKQIVDEAKVPAESLKPLLTTSRSARRSQDLDLNPSYTSLLLQDIQNFHQKSITTPFTLPQCVTKACSILEAVADLNSSTQISTVEPRAHKALEGKEPIVESEVLVSDDLVEPSLHKYVTVRRRMGVDMDDEESSGSNSFIGGGGGQLHSGLGSSFSSTWEPNSAESTDCWTTSKDDKCSLGLSCESGRGREETRKRLVGKRKDSDLQHNSEHGSALIRGLKPVSPIAAASL